MTKVCSQCGVEKDIDKYGIQSRNKDLHSSECKRCRQARRERDRVKTKEYNKRYRDKNRDKLNKYNVNYRKENKEKINNWREMNREKINISSCNWSHRNREKINLRNKKYPQEMPDFYIINLIKRSIDISHADITKTLIDLKKSELKLKRAIKHVRG